MPNQSAIPMGNVNQTQSGQTGPTLVVLAAGMGSRYGGLKQVDKLGPWGETIIDYAVFDAIMAGFSKLVLVIRKSIEQDFLDTYGKGFLQRIPYEFVYQELDVLPEGFSVPEGRTKPWGTAHALWVARHAIPGDFVVINADDFYGREAYQALFRFLTSEKKFENAYAMCGYRLVNTLSQHGTVSRGICHTDPQGYLKQIEEHLKIGYDADRKIVSDHHDKMIELQEDTVVSMNIWAFGKAFFETIDRYLTEFLTEHGTDLKSELYTPLIVDMLLRDNKGSVKVLATEAQWFGVTYADDKPLVQARLQQLVANGTYPSPLWT